MCQDYRIQYKLNAISAMPTNLYGPNDNFHPENSLVLPVLIRRLHEAKVSGDKEVVVWGSGSPLREFLHVDDLADSVVFLLENYSDSGHVNVGSGKGGSIKELAELVKEVVGLRESLFWILRSLMELLGSLWITQPSLSWVGNQRFLFGMALLALMNGMSQM